MNGKIHFKSKQLKDAAFNISFYSNAVSIL